MTKDGEWVGGEEMKETDLSLTLPCSCSLPPLLDAICGNQIPRWYYS